MWMHLFSPYRDIDDDHYAQLLMLAGPTLDYEHLSEGFCSRCKYVARECILCNTLFCKQHYKEHNHEPNTGVQGQKV